MSDELTPQEKAHADAEAARLIADWISDNGPVATTYRDPTPVRPTGAQPVAQRGRTPMSQKAADISGVMLAAGLASLPIGGMTALVLYVVGQSNPVNLAIGAGAPVSLVVAVGITAKMISRAVREGAQGVAQAASAMPPGEVHHHHTGPSYIENRNLHVNTDTRWLGKTHNEIHG
ncbi:hypothetical protein ACFVXW_27070 [Streptomyces sp. NPDC058251]|uniref:hypothetical protein n=1 Tax=Streptomyces sp. NPDC058251 TaxID=3346404 RepID=UPI0036EEC7AE